MFQVNNSLLAHVQYFKLRRISRLPLRWHPRAHSKCEGQALAFRFAHTGLQTDGSVYFIADSPDHAWAMQLHFMQTGPR